MFRGTMRGWCRARTARTLPAALLVAVALGTVVAVPAHAAEDSGSPASAITSSPKRPKICTPAQLEKVSIDRCTVMLEGTPADHGFPEPPFPTDAITTSAIPASEWRTLQPGARSPLVIVLQQHLKSLYPSVAVTGRFGQQTKMAVRRFQTASGLAVTGRVDAATASALGLLVRASLPKFPPEGWRWSGWSYSGSPAIAAWEQRLTEGPTRLDPIAAPLFEGFLADLRRGTYRIDEADSYSFRCTALTGKNCKGLGSAMLSYHAWGLAVDLNYSANPLQDVTDDADACAAATEHSIPDWVLATAQHWGLFWGGWYSCPDANETSVVKDPHHFEFRGTPELAQAILAKNTKKGAKRASVPGITNLYLSCGDSGAAVTKLRKLLPRSYRPRESEEVRPTFTPALARALARWQADHGLVPTGALDPETAAALGVRVRHHERFPVLHLHSCGGAVQAVQQALGVAVTGTFDGRTLAALRSWQTKHGLGPTGVTDTATAAALGLDLVELAQQPSFDPSVSTRSVSPKRVSVPTSGARLPGRPHHAHR